MGLFDRPEVTVLKESSDAKRYLEQLESLRVEVPKGTELAGRIDKEIAITKAGIAGEDAILFELKNSGMDLVVLHDLYIETADGRGAQIDFLVLTPYVNVFIESKNLFGDIEINNKGEFIRTFSYGGRKTREGIYSPITQNERHMTVFKEIRGSERGALMRAAYEKGFQKYNIPLVVLANPKTVVNDRFAPKEIKKRVIRCDQLIATLKSLKSDIKSSKKENIKNGETYLTMNRENRKEYIRKFEEMKEGLLLAQTAHAEKPGEIPSEAAAESVQDGLICPWCGKQLILRTAKKGTNVGRQFYGCSGFPKCHYIRNS